MNFVAELAQESLEKIDDLTSAVTGKDIVIGCAVLALTWPTAWVIGWIVRRSIRRLPIPAYLVPWVVRLAHTMVSLIGLAIAMTWFGVDVRWFTVVLVFSAVVTFLVLRPLVENFSAGLLLETRSAFAVGDEIETKGRTGEVVEVNGRTTVLRTRDGRRIHIPSTEVLASTITVYTAFESRRSSIELSIDDGADIERVVDVLVDAIADVDGVHGDPKPSGRARGLGNATVLIELHWWHGPSLGEESQAYDKVVRKLKETISAEGIVMPPPKLLVSRLDDG